MANLPTADSLFDPIEAPLPKADELFGESYSPKPIGPSATWGRGVGRSGAGGTKDFLATTSLGRIMDATGHGAKEGWGAAPIGLSEENKLRITTGDYSEESKKWATAPFTTGGSLTEMFVQPLAAALDVVLRTPQSAVGALASGANQAAAEWSPKWLNKLLNISPTLSTNVKDNVVSEEQAAALNNQLGAVMALATFPDAVYSGLKPVPAEAMLNRQQAFSKAIGDVDVPLPPVLEAPTVGAPNPMRPSMPKGMEQEVVKPTPTAPVLINNTTDELQGIAQQVRDQQDNGYASIFGDAEVAKTYENLNRIRLNTSDDAYAAKLQKQVDDLAAALPPEKQKALDDMELMLDQGDASAYQKLANISHKYDNLNDASPEQIIKASGEDLLKTSPAALERVLTGRGDIEDQTNILPFIRVYNNLRERWVDATEIRDRLVGEFRSSYGDDAEYIVDETLKQLAATQQGKGPLQIASQTTQEAPTEPLIAPAPTPPAEPTIAPMAPLETPKDIDVAQLGEAGSLEGQVLAINPDLVMYNQYGTRTSMVDINNLSEVTGVPVDALMRRESPYSSLDPVQSIKLEKAFKEMAETTQELGRNVKDEASAMAYLQSRQKVIQSLVDVERKDYLKGLALKSEQVLSKEDKLKNRAVATFFRDQDFEGAFTPEGVLTPEGLRAIQAEAEEVRKINSAAGINKYLRKKTKDQASGFYSKTRDMGLEYLYNWGMLSSPKTHAANIISNTLISMLRVGETGLAGGIGTVRSIFTKADDRVYLGEAYQKAFGLVQGMPEGLLAAAKALALEEPTFGRANKVELNKKAIPGTLGKAIRLPGNVMMAEDEFFKAMAYRASINSQAYREAVKKGYSGNKFSNHIAKRVASPTDDMRLQAYKEADYDTFTKELGATGKKIEALGREWPVAKFLTFPFMRTPTNIFKFMGERTPLSLASKEVRSVLKGDKGKAARDEQVAKMLIGSSVMYLGFKWASQGKLTGNGPKDSIQRAQWLGEGNQPNSVQIDGEQYRLDRLGPLGTLLSVAADSNDIWDKRGRAATEKIAAGDMPSVEELGDMNVMLMVMAGNIANQLPLVNGINDLSDAMNEDDGYKAQKFMINLGQRVVPAIGADIERMNDPYLRDIRTFQDALNARIPWKGQEVPAMLDTFGQPIPNTMQGWGNLANPVQHKSTNKDPVFTAMQEVGYNMARPNKVIGGVELTRDQYREYWQLSGTASKIALTQLIEAIPDWNTIPPQIRKEMMVNTVKRVRETSAGIIKLKYLGQPNDIFKQMYDNKMDMFSPAGDE